MLVLITYDVNTETAAGKARLRKVAKQCVNYGTRVQNSVFECILDPAQCLTLKARSGSRRRFFRAGAPVPCWPPRPTAPVHGGAGGRRKHCQPVHTED